MAGIFWITMVAQIIRNVSEKILIVGPVYDNVDKLLKVETLIPNYQYVIFNGNLYYPFCNLSDLQDRLDIMTRLIKTGKVIYNLGDNDYLLIDGLMTEYPDSIGDWYLQRPNVVMIEFTNSTQIIVTSGGVIPKMNKEKLMDNLETSFVSKIKDKPWHELYKGAYGYIISNNPLSAESPEFYNHSMRIGTTKESGTVFAQEASQFGLKETILL